MEILGWVSTAGPGLGEVDVREVPRGAIASGGTLSACAAGDRGLIDRGLIMYFRIHGVTGRTSYRVVLDFPAGADLVALGSAQPGDDDEILYYGFVTNVRDTAVALRNGPYAVAIWVEASGVYTPVATVTATRACP